MSRKPYTFDEREWSASGARNALRNAAAAMKKTGVPRLADGARLVSGRWQSVAARPELGTEIMESGRSARRLLSLRRKAADARDRAGRAADAAARQVGTPMEDEWRLMSKDAFHSAEAYAARAAVMAHQLNRKETS